MRAWRIESDGGIDALSLVNVESRQPGAGEIAVRLRANSINYRDLMIVKEPRPRGIAFPRIPNSDGAGEVTAVGSGVTNVKPGDRVVSCVYQDWLDGSCSRQAMANLLGGPIDGVLAETAILRATGVVPMPDRLSFEEAATLPVAALTAWAGIVEWGRVKAGDWVLLLGTGGVSIFALQFAKMMGVRVFITSSSDKKLERARALGATATVNYSKHPNWEEAVLEATGGEGVDLSLEVGGAGTLPQTIAATRVSGTIALIGAMVGGAIDPATFMRKYIRVQGIYCGSRRMFLDMNRAISAHGLKPVIDKTYDFTDAQSAYRHMESAAHLGKIAIKI